MYPKFLSFRSKEIIIIGPGFSLKASLLHSWQCPAILNFAVHEIVQRAEVLNRESTGGQSNYYRCKNLTINYLTPLLVMHVMHTIGFDVLSKLASSLSR